jgi:hypothetical protein
MGVAFDVWVVEERCGCGVDRSCEVEEGHRSSEPNSTDGDREWRGGEGDVFSEGRTDSDSSEAGEVPLGLQQVGRKQLSVLAVANEGIRNVDLHSQTFLDVTNEERMADQQIENSHVEGVGEGYT